MSETTTENPLAKNKGLVIITVMMVAILEVLDSTIVNVSLPHMMGSLGANTEQITWVLTSYIVASAIVMPLTGLLEHRFGRKQLLMMNIMGFMISSMLCGMSTSIEMMVLCRVLQGAFGAALIPLSQVILNDTFPKEEQTKAMAIWGIGLMAAPVLGPTIGGFITEHMSWRWVFYINIPGCLLSFFLASFLIPKTEKQHRPIDWLGLLFMAVALGGMQLVLDQGNTKDWFQSNYILVTTIVATIALVTFLVRGWNRKHHIINLQLFKDKNFSASTLMLALFCGAIFGNMALQPMMLEQIMGYTPIKTGFIMAPRGIACALGMAFVTPLIKKFSFKAVLLMSAILSAFGTYMMIFYTAQMNTWAIIWPTIIQGFGMGLFFVPLSAQALVSISKKDSAEAAGLFGYGRMLGSSVGISLSATLINRESQINWSNLSSHINAYNPAVHQWLADRHLSIFDPVAIKHIVTQIAQQAGMIAYLDCNLVVAISFLGLIPLVFMLEHVDSSTNPMEMMH